MATKSSLDSWSSSDELSESSIDSDVDFAAPSIFYDSPQSPDAVTESVSSFCINQNGGQNSSAIPVYYTVRWTPPSTFKPPAENPSSTKSYINVIELDDSDSEIEIPLQDKILFEYPRCDQESNNKVVIRVRDIQCLDVPHWLNDTVIDFWNRYVYLEKLAAKDRERSHVFSSLFFPSILKALQSFPSMCIPVNTPWPSYTGSVSVWVKNLDIFSKDFLFVPICQNNHWILVVMCFPRLIGTHPRKDKKANPEKVDKESRNGEPSDNSKCEDSDCEEEEGGKGKTCILIMDSMSTEDSRKDLRLLLDVLRVFLSVEWNSKNSPKIAFTQDICPEYFVEVPQQPNDFDCGVYVLKFFEMFLLQPIRSYESSLNKSNWFTEKMAATFRNSMYSQIQCYMNTHCPENLPLLPKPAEIPIQFRNDTNFRNSDREETSYSVSEESSDSVSEESSDSVSEESNDFVSEESSDFVSEESSEFVFEEPSYPVFVEPTYPVFVEPTYYPFFVQPTYPVFVQPTYCAFVQPTYCAFVQPTYHVFMKPSHSVFEEPSNSYVEELSDSSLEDSSESVCEEPSTSVFENSSSGNRTGVENPENSDSNKITPIVSTDLKPQETATDLLTSKLCVSEAQLQHCDSSVTLTSVLRRSVSSGPIKAPSIAILRKSRRIIRAAQLAKSLIPLKVSSMAIPTKGTTTKVPDLKVPPLSVNRNKEESDKKTKDSVTTAAKAKTGRANTAAGANTNVNLKRKRKLSTSSSEIIAVKKKFDSSPKIKSKMSVEDRNNSDAIRKSLCLEWNKLKKNDKPTLESKGKVVEEKGGKGKSNSIAVVGRTSDQTADMIRAISPDITDIRGYSQRYSKAAASKKQKENQLPTSHTTSKVNTEPESPFKVDDDPRVTCDEMPSNVLGYTAMDYICSNTSKMPPTEPDAVLAKDSSLNPLRLPTPAVVPPLKHFSYSEKHDHQGEFDPKDRAAYMDHAKRLKHRADNETVSATQACTYLEAGLYRVLVGISMEEDRAIKSTEAYMMYQGTLDYIRDIRSRFLKEPEDYNSVEGKIIILSMRCQALLSLKLFEFKISETKQAAVFVKEDIQKMCLSGVPPVPSLQVNTHSPHTLSAAQAGSSAVAFQDIQDYSALELPNDKILPRYIHPQMLKYCCNVMNLMNAHELWKDADGLVEIYHVEEFFISIDRKNGGPLTFHTKLPDLVRYAKQVLLVLQSGAEI